MGTVGNKTKSKKSSQSAGNDVKDNSTMSYPLAGVLILLLSAASYYMGQVAQEQMFATPDSSGTTCSAADKEQGTCSAPEAICLAEDTEHMLIDVHNLKNQEYLTNYTLVLTALPELLSGANTRMLGYHCHSVFPTESATVSDGYHCIGMLPDRGHVSIHADRPANMLYIDLFNNCKIADGKSSGWVALVNAWKKKLFDEEPFDPPPLHPEMKNDDQFYNHMRWWGKIRGFGYRTMNRAQQMAMGGSLNPLQMDLGDMVHDGDYLLDKLEIASVKTMFQQIDIYDMLDMGSTRLSSYRKSIYPGKEKTYYESSNPELFTWDRVIFLDGVMQSAKQDNEAYHEALVQPGMFAHPNPRRVAIIGGGEGATLREVLKHDTVIDAKMIEIDEIMVNVSREYLPGWNSCDDIVGSVSNCFKDPRSDMYYEDAMAWFITRYDQEGDDDDGDEDGDDDYDYEDEEELLDVIIMDALDPQEAIPFADVLYNNVAFIRSLFYALSEDGVLVMQLGETAHQAYPAEELTDNLNRAKVIKSIESLGFVSMHIYDEEHCGFGGPWSFLVACKSNNCHNNWYKNPAQIELAMHKRLRRSVSKKPMLKYFDGRTMQSYQYPTFGWEVSFCRKDPKPEECKIGIGYSNTQLKHLSFDENFEIKFDVTSKSLELYSKVDIPKLSNFLIDDIVMEISSELLKYEDSDLPFNSLAKLLGSSESSLSRSYISIVSSAVRGECSDANVQQLEVWKDGEAKEDDGSNRTGIYNPLLDRHLTKFETGLLFRPLRDISKGDAICTNLS